MATGTEFLRLRFTGTRFEDGAVPYGAIKDIAALQKMAVEVAKWKFHEANPERDRLPKGFPKDTDWELSRIEHGSSMPIVSLTPPMSQSSFADYQMPHQKWLEEARDAIIGTIDDYRSGKHLSSDAPIPRKHLEHFRRFGQSLREGECLELSSTDGRVSTSFTRSTRQRILDAIAQTPVEDKVRLRGFVFEADHQKMTFQFHEKDGPSIKISFREDERQVVMDALAGYTSHKAVEIHGVGIFNPGGGLLGMESVDSIEILDQLNILSQLDDLRAMKDGWLDGDGIAPLEDGLDWLRAQFERYYPDLAPLPYIYPTTEGGVEVEWSLKPYEIGMTIDLTDHSGEWFWINMSNDDHDERNLDMDDHGHWSWIVGELQRLSGDYT